MERTVQYPMCVYVVFLGDDAKPCIWESSIYRGWKLVDWTQTGRI